MDSVDLFPIVGSLVLFSGLLLYLGRPLFSGQTRMASSGGTRRLFERKEQLLGAIVELEFDRDIGKVPAEDFMRIFAELEGVKQATAHRVRRREIDDRLTGMARLKTTVFVRWNPHAFR